MCVRFDLPRLGDISGLRGVHLQCHIGTDTVSLSRLGAAMSGLDFSPASIAVARDLADSAGADIDFHIADVYDAVEVLGAGGTTWCSPGSVRSAGCPTSTAGVMSWPRCCDRAAGCSYARATRCCGRWPIPGRTVLVAIEYPYFTQVEAMVWDEEGTYVTSDVNFEHTVSHEWNHGLGEIVTSLLDAGLVITGLTEHASVPWNARPGEMVETDGEWRMRDGAERFPCSYTLQARKPD